MYSMMDTVTPNTENMTVSFNLPKEQYEALSKKLPKFGDKTAFFRTVVEKYLKGQLEIERKF